MSTGFWWENKKERGNLEGLSVCGRIILKWILNRMGSEEGEILGCRGQGIEGSSNVNCWEVFD